MNLNAYTRTINDILTLNRKYVIPRFQREFDWGEAEHKVFWNDIINSIKVDNGNLMTTEYFIGSLVLVGDDTQNVQFEVVDGQQRLTTITIILSALTHIFREISEESLAQSCYSYVQGRDGDYNPFFKLVNENPKPFLQRRIQNIEVEDEYTPSTEEEEKLLNAYKFYYNNSKEETLLRYFEDGFLYKDILKAIRDQILKFKTIFITVSNIEEAYTIFETLNAKGKDLETIDLIKNKIFKVLNGDHPTDEAKEKWKKIKENLMKREKRINISAFFRHYWISKYEFLTESKIYNSFNKEVQESVANYKVFLDELVHTSEIYSKIVNPHEIDWRQQEEKEILYSLRGLNIFNVQQPRTFLLSLIDARSRAVINVNQLRDTIKLIEKFHFVFTAVSSMSASGLESKYSTLSRKLRSSSNRQEARNVIVDLRSYYAAKIPDESRFKSKFQDIVYTNDKTYDKKLIQYIFACIEKYLQGTDELTPFNLSLEHIRPQSSGDKCIGKIGNLLPLSRNLNEEAKDYNLDRKIPIYNESNLKIVNDFVDQNQEKSTWDSEDIEQRTQYLAEFSYREVWSL